MRWKSGSWQIRDENLRFGLLTDFRDADEEKLPDDEAAVYCWPGRESKS